MILRSSAWFDRDDEVALDARVALAMAGQSWRSGQPIIALINSSGGFNPCNLPLDDLVAPLRAGVESAGGVAVEVGVMSLGEDVMKPAAMLYRNLVAMDVEETLRSQPVDGVIILAACDKSVPAGVMGAWSTNLPTLLVVAGPRPTSMFRGRRIGTGTDLWRTWDARRAGDMDDASWQEFEHSLTTGRGTCNTMGTASTMAICAETLGLAWPGVTLAPAGDSRHVDAAREVGARIVALVKEGSRPSERPRAAWDNTLKVLSAIGGSTNAVIHLTAMARRLGVELRLEEFDIASRHVPVLCDVEPTGRGLVEDLDAVGGVPALWRALGDRLDGEVRLADGRRLAEHAAEAPEASGVLRSLDNPVDPGGAFRVVRGNLAPDGALIKRCAASIDLLRHRGPAVVLRSAEEADAFARGDGDLDPESVIVLSGAGPLGGPGMPEWAMVSLPPALVRRGVHDMVRVSDARMSGTSFGTVFLHVAPEAAVGGPLAHVRDGDMISVDADGGVITLEVDEAELAARASTWRPAAAPSRGYLALYAAHVLQAPEGCDFDVLRGSPGVAPTLDEPVVGRA